MDSVTASIHSLPFETTFRGESDVTENFYNLVSESKSEEGKGYEARFRGRALKASIVAIPEGYCGTVLRLATISKSLGVITSESSASPNGANGATHFQPAEASSREDGSAAKRSRGWLLADEDDSQDLFTAKFRTEDLKRQSESEKQEYTPVKSHTTNSVKTLPSIPSDNKLYPHPSTSSHSSAALATVARRSILAFPSTYTDDNGIERTITDDDLTIVKDFSSILMWEHDYMPNSQDTEGARLWIEVAEVLHSS